MPRFLSPEWVEDLDRALGDSEELARAAGDIEIGIQQLVVAGQTTLAHVIRIHRGRVTVRAGRDDSADLVISEDLETARAVARGELSPQAALGRGRIRVRGDLSGLALAYPVLAAAGPALAELRARTEW